LDGAGQASESEPADGAVDDGCGEPADTVEA
jgi:hypothetical protein